MSEFYHVDGRKSGTGLDAGDEMPPSGGMDFARYDAGFAAMQSAGLAIMVVIILLVVMLYVGMFAGLFDPAQAGIDAAHAMATAIAE